MKNLIVTTLTGMSMLLCVACKEDNEKPAPSLEAKWELQQIGRIEENGDEDLSDHSNADGCDKSNFELLNDGTTRCLSFHRDEESEMCEESVVSGTWTKGNHEFTMIFPGPYERVYKVLELTETTLKIKFLSDSPEKQTAEADNLWTYKKISE